MMKFFANSSRLAYIKNYSEVVASDEIWQYDFNTNKEYIMVKHNCQIMNFCFEKDVFYIVDEHFAVTRFDHKTQQIASVGLTSLPNYPDIARQFKPFDMGYSYLMKCRNGVLAIITDLGLFIVEIV